ncbi:MAG: SIS domain-containing protein, partial [Acidimicrobiales bacterium]
LDSDDGPYVTAALNGDVDNYAELRTEHGLHFPDEVTTDAKVIPALVSRAMDDGRSVCEAFLGTVTQFEGSVAIAASAADDPDRLHLALRGSGQSLYVGLAEDAFVVASEPYGLVQETSRYIRMDGDVTQGQVVVLDRSDAGTLAGMERRRYNGAPLPLEPAEECTAEITTRDIDRGGFPHFLIKEIFQAPSSLRKTLRGKVLPGPDGRLAVGLGRDALPVDLVAALSDHRIRRVVVIGQGTAAVAGRAVAAAAAHCLPGIPAQAQLATELSGFGLTDDMSDTLVVAISQSGTTTDTNRAVDLARARGAHVVAVVNRRNSDLVSKAHGTLFTSDGRDIEMSVASTKAFYAQVAAGWLLALGLADAAGCVDPREADRLLKALRRLPGAMEAVLAHREEIGRIAAAVAPPRRHWTVVGSGPDAIAAAEVRIKLSELCYRSIAYDSIEDKKHIDLSSEPLILVCAAGLWGPNAEDVAKEVAIYRAHKACPVVVAAEPEAARFSSGAEVVAVPACEPELAFVLSAMVGHLFGYEAALAIDAQARPLRAARAVLDEAAGVPAAELLRVVGGPLAEAAAPFVAGLASGSYDGNLEASKAVRAVSLLRYVTGAVPVEGYEVESGKIGSPDVLVADLYDALSGAIDQLTRPVDAIKHQAKTVTVGTSRREDELLARRLVRETLAVGASADALGYRALRTLAAVDAGVDEVLGFTRYRIDWPPGTWPTAVVVDQGGDMVGVASRTVSDPRLKGTKHRAAEEREVTITRGARDGRTVILVPEVKANAVIGMTLLHVRFAGTLPASTVRAVMTGYRGRYAALRDAVTESEPAFDDARLAEVPLVDLLTEPVYVLAALWRPPPAHP